MPLFKDWRCRNLLPLRFVSSKKKRIFGIDSNKTNCHSTIGN